MAWEESPASVISAVSLTEGIIYLSPLNLACWSPCGLWQAEGCFGLHPQTPTILQGCPRKTNPSSPLLSHCRGESDSPSVNFPKADFPNYIILQAKMQISLCLSLKNAIIMTALILPTHTNGINMAADAQQTDD